MMFTIAIAITSLIAGAVAAISGFGIGSLLTPVFALRYPLNLAVGIVSIPHLIGTAARFVRLRSHVNRRVFIHFGILSAIGGLLGALLHARANSPTLAIVFGCLLLFAGISGLIGLTQRMRFGRRTAWIAGALSGIFGGLVGNQGGIRSAALLGFDVRKEELVATATAIALVVDGARMPVYFVVERQGILDAWPLVIASVAGVLAGTFGGVRMLRLIPERVFRKVLSVLITALGIYMLVRR